MKCKESIPIERCVQGASTERFWWLTKNKAIASLEKALLKNIDFEGCNSILEVGSGEGANIHNIGSNKKLFYGIDISFEKLRFAKIHLNGAGFVCADALDMPFRDNTFDLVFCKDVLHHVGDRDKMIEEMIRVCRPEKKMVILEANGKNLIWNFFGSIVNIEKDVKNNTMAAFKRSLFGKYSHKFSKISIDLLYDPVFLRLLTYYKFGLKNLGNSARFTFFCNMSKYIKKFSVKRHWPYILAQGIKK